MTYQKLYKKYLSNAVINNNERERLFGENIIKIKKNSDNYLFNTKKQFDIITVIRILLLERYRYPEYKSMIKLLINTKEKEKLENIISIIKYQNYDIRLDQWLFISSLYETLRTDFKIKMNLEFIFDQKEIEILQKEQRKNK